MLIKVFGTAVDVDRIVYVEFATDDNATYISLGGPDCVWIKNHTVGEVLAEISKRVPAVDTVGLMVSGRNDVWICDCGLLRPNEQLVCGTCKVKSPHFPGKTCNCDNLDKSRPQAAPNYPGDGEACQADGKR